jgi:hypothetical protein
MERQPCTSGLGQGMMEYWNVDLKEELLATNMLAPMSTVIFLMNQCPIPQSPLFQYSSIPVFQL